MNYREYIRSDKWREKANKWKIEEGKCEKCGSGFNLNVHHLNYENLGYELRKDVRVLCRSCHSKYHKGNWKYVMKKKRTSRNPLTCSSIISIKSSKRKARSLWDKIKSLKRKHGN